MYSNEKKIFTFSILDYVKNEQVLKANRSCFYSIFFMKKGSCCHVLDFEEYKLNEGDILIIRPGQVHHISKINDADGVVIVFTEETLFHKFRLDFLPEQLTFFSEFYFAFLFHLSVEDQKNMDRLVCNLQFELSMPQDELNEILLLNSLSSLLLNITRVSRNSQRRTNSKSNKEMLYALKFKRLIEKSFHKQLSILEYAEELGLNIRVLQKISQTYFEKTPKKMVQEFILLESKRMLADRTLQIKKIAFDLGFNEQTNFTKFFKKNIGITPEKFRNSIFENF